MDKEYQKLLDSFASIDEKFKQIKGKKVVKTTTVQNDDQSGAPDTEPDADDMMDHMRGIADELYGALRRTADYLHNRVNDVHSRVDQSNAALHDHANPQNATHPPFLKTPTQVQAYLEACKMGGDVEVKKPTIYAKASKKSHYIEVDLTGGTK